MDPLKALTAMIDTKLPIDYPGYSHTAVKNSSTKNPPFINKMTIELINNYIDSITTKNHISKG